MKRKQKFSKNLVSVNPVPSLFLFILLCQFGCAYCSPTIMANGNICWPFTKRLCKHLLYAHIDLRHNLNAVRHLLSRKLNIPFLAISHLAFKWQSEFQTLLQLSSSPAVLFPSGLSWVCLAHSMYFLPCLTGGLGQHVRVASC